MLQRLTTEQQNPASEDIDRLSTVEMLQVINQADAQIAAAVAAEIPNIARAVDAASERLRAGGRMFYVGAGTSGRLGVLDASECPPTFNVPPETVQGLIAGGDRALRHAVERAEDDPEACIGDLQERQFSAADVLVGIAASGRTPYVAGGLQWARQLGAVTVAVSCVTDSEIAKLAEIAITPVPGPEVITGSTRMRAGTATKLVLNMLSTGVMIRLGYVYGNLMVNVQATNEKLVDRARRIISKIAGISYDQAAVLLEESNSVRVAIIMSRRGMTRAQAEKRLQEARGSLRAALDGAVL